MAEPATVEVSAGGKWLPLSDGLQTFGPTSRYVWETDVFTFGQSLQYWQPFPGPGWPGIDYGRTSFSVQTSGTVYMATSTRYLNSGNSSGDWVPELTYPDELAADGWELIGTGLSDKSVAVTQTDADWNLYRRESTAGESFTYRTEKYLPPIL